MSEKKRRLYSRYKAVGAVRAELSQVTRVIEREEWYLESFGGWEKCWNVGWMEVTCFGETSRGWMPCKMFILLSFQTFKRFFFVIEKKSCRKYRARGEMGSSRTKRKKNLSWINPLEWKILSILNFIQKARQKKELRQLEPLLRLFAFNITNLFIILATKSKLMNSNIGATHVLPNGFHFAFAEKNYLENILKYS